MSGHLVADPLKLASFGVKRPLEEKNSKIAKLEQSGGRQQYYPRLPNGQIDEWHALVQMQADLAKKEDVA